MVPKDANGKVLEPFVIDGTTFLPVRAVGEALNQAVSWDGKTSTVYIGTNAAAAQPSVWLKDLDTLTGKYDYNSKTASYTIKDNVGNTYDNFLGEIPTGEVSYALNGQYSRFTAKLILRDSSKDLDYQYRLKVYCDDKLVYTSESITAGSFPVAADVDVKGALKMKIVWESDCPNVYNGAWWEKKHTPGEFALDNSNSDVFMVNAGLWQ